MASSGDNVHIRRHGDSADLLRVSHRGGVSTPPLHQHLSLTPPAPRLTFPSISTSPHPHRHPHPHLTLIVTLTSPLPPPNLTK